MATTVVSVAAHHPPPISMSMQSIPRIRPPRLLPGTPSPNTDPQPPGPVPEGKVWVQGRWRKRGSNAARHVEKVTRAQVSKAVKHHRYGLDIFAYYHLRTSQVVYSLTRVMQTGQIMPQLVFHGKKTVPAVIRRDVWRPYFSIHFPDTSVGRRAGLTAYQILREFAMRRQLSPEHSTLMTTTEDIEKIKRKAGDPVQVREKIRDEKLRLPLLGHKLPQKLRAQKLMDQRATSVADVAFVLDGTIQWMTRHKREDFDVDNTREKLKQLGRRGQKRLKAIRRREAELQDKIAARQAMAHILNPETRKFSLADYQSSTRAISTLNQEPDASLPKSSTALNGTTVKQTPGRRRRPSPIEIQMFWADMRDGTYAQSWPDKVYHSELLTYSPSFQAKAEAEAEDDDGTTRLKKTPPSKTFEDGYGESLHTFGHQHINDPKGVKAAQERARLEEERERQSPPEVQLEEPTEREPEGWWEKTKDRVGGWFKGTRSTVV